MQSTKLELIRMIADIQSESLLERIRQFLQEIKREEKAPALSREEAELLARINEGLPEEVQHRYNELLAKSADETLTESEHRELLQLNAKAEAQSAERLTYLLQLAALWDTSVDKAMERLGIQPSVPFDKTDRNWFGSDPSPNRRASTHQTVTKKFRS